MEASQHALTAKSSDNIDSLEKTKIELEEQVKSLEEKLQEKNEVGLHWYQSQIQIFVTLCRSVPDWKKS